MKLSTLWFYVAMFFAGLGTTLIVRGVINLSDATTKKQIEEVKIQRSERIQEMAEAIILADKMRGSDNEAL